jgi:predicted O-methyltransferase YrrM
MTDILEKIKPTCSWLSTYGPLADLCREVEAKTLIEVGVAYGFHAEYILNSLNTINYTGIDPYLANYDPTDCFCSDVCSHFGGNNAQEAMDRLYQCVKQKLSEYKNANLLRGTFEEASSKFEDDSVDVIFIDGDHTFEGVLKDLKTAYKKVNKKRGIICGDDITWEGVKAACDQFFQSNNLTYTIERSLFVSRFNS